MSNEERVEARCLPCQDTRLKDEYAWINLMPPRPDDFHVVAEAFVANPGIDPILVPKEPQGINPRILLLDLYLRQQPGIWPQVFVWKPVRYDKIVRGTRYTQVQIFCGDQIIADLPVDEVR